MYDSNIFLARTLDMNFVWSPGQPDLLDFEDPTMYSTSPGSMFGNVLEKYGHTSNPQYSTTPHGLPPSRFYMPFATGATGFEAPATLPTGKPFQGYNTRGNFDTELRQPHRDVGLGTNAPIYTSAASDTLTAPKSIHPDKSTSESIGIVHFDEASQNTTFSCRLGQCTHKNITFARLPDLKRHYGEQHALSKPSIWCSEAGCPRSEGGERPFRRMEKCAEHVKRFHSGVLG